MDVNEIQIGGSHYKGKEYQHWDFCIETKIPYVLGCATKYPTRWKDKGGIEDLRKCIHYISKAEEEKEYVKLSKDNLERIERFSHQFEEYECDIIAAICINDFQGARTLLQELIENNITCEAGPGYVNQDYIRG